MENKRYLDKVIEHLVRGTKVDYENKRIIFPFSFPPLPFPSLSHTFLLLSSSPFFSFSSYCNNTYGLTEEEIGYVWDEYKEIILDKIEYGQ